MTRALTLPRPIQLALLAVLVWTPTGPTLADPPEGDAAVSRKRTRTRRAPRRTPRPDPALNDADVLTVLDALGAALLRGDGAAAAQAYDWAEVALDMARRGAIEPAALGPDFASRLAADQASRLAGVGSERFWRSTEIADAAWQADGRLRVNVRHLSPDRGRDTLHRYWLRPGPTGLRIVDQEAVDTAARLTDFLALAVKAARAVDAPVWLPALQALDDLLARRARGDVTGVLERLAELRRLPAPEPLAHQLGLLQAEALVLAGQPESAFSVVQALRTAAPNLPGGGVDALPLALDRTAALALEALNRCPEATRHAERFLKHFPDDSSSWAVIGLCHGRAGRRAKAAEALGRALATDRRSVPALGGLLLYAPDGEDPLVAHRLRTTDDLTRAALLRWFDHREAHRAHARLERLLP
jgi:tetratricopeptide (TPR) repeat protein